VSQVFICGTGFVWQRFVFVAHGSLRRKPAGLAPFGREYSARRVRMRERGGKLLKRQRKSGPSRRERRFWRSTS
jgi:hypothetical protein